jgi:hypothetical protein
MAEAMVAKGKSKYTRKISSMHTNYRDAASRAQSNYEKVGFKATRVSAYKAAWSDMPGNYAAKVTTAAADKWATNWKAAMF